MRAWRTADKELVIDVLTERADELISLFFMALAYTYNHDVGSDGFSARSPTSVTSSNHVYGVLRMSYPIRSMKHMRGLWKILATKIGNLHTDCSSASQRHPIHFVSRSSPNFSHSISRPDQHSHFWLIGIRKTQKTPFYPRVPVFSRLSTSMVIQLFSSHIFQSRST